MEDSMSLERELQIGPYLYRIRETGKIVSFDEGVIEGQTHPQQQTIELLQSSPQSRKVAAWWEEIIHGISDAYGIWHDDNLEDSVSHQKVRQLSTAFYLLFRDNPGIGAYLDQLCQYGTSYGQNR